MLRKNWTWTMVVSYFVLPFLMKSEKNTQQVKYKVKKHFFKKLRKYFYRICLSINHCLGEHSLVIYLIIVKQARLYTIHTQNRTWKRLMFFRSKNNLSKTKLTNYFLETFIAIIKPLHILPLLAEATSLYNRLSVSVCMCTG